MDLGIARPTPAHALTDGAEAARNALRLHAFNRRLSRDLDALVTDHNNPRVEAWPGDVVTRGARSLLETAKAKGWRVNLIEQPDRCTVEGVRGLEGFRATWVRGRASSASWHEARDRYELIVDNRAEPKLAEKTRTSLANRRPVGTSRVRLELVASPRGIPMNVTALVKRVSES